MTKTEFKKVWNRANKDVDTLYTIDDSILHGCALPDFTPVSVSVEVAAIFLRRHAMQLNGEWDMLAVNEVKEYFTSNRKVTLL